MQQIKKLKLGCYCQIGPTGEGPGQTKEKTRRSKGTQMKQNHGGEERQSKPGSDIDRQARCVDSYSHWRVSKLPFLFGSTSVHLKSRPDPSMKGWWRELKWLPRWVATSPSLLSSRQGQVYFGDFFMDYHPYETLSRIFNKLISAWIQWFGTSWPDFWVTFPLWLFSLKDIAEK